MGPDKAGTRGGGFFNLFDWNKKSRKKLFASGVSPEATKQARKNDGNFPTTRFVLNEDADEFREVASIKGSSDYSCSSSVTDEDVNGTRAPGVVARLMGLDSLPTTSAFEPYATPYFDRRTLRGDPRCQKITPEYDFSAGTSSNAQFVGSASTTAAAASASTTPQVYLRKPPEMKRQKMPSSPIDKFQTEMLPSRTAKSLPLTHHKLLSPIKNSRFISADNAAHIMEAAAKILNPAHHHISCTTTRVRPPSLPLVVVRDPQHHNCSGTSSSSSSYRTPRFPESSSNDNKPTESNAAKYLKGQSLTKSWNGSECQTTTSSSYYKASPLWSEDSRNKGKSVSLAIQAKVNVQKREGINAAHHNSFIHFDQPDVKSNHSSLKRDPSVQKNKLHRKVPQPSASGVLKQNNLKQNSFTNKDKLSSRPGQQNRKAVNGGVAAATRNKSFNKNSGASKVASGKPDLRASNAEKESTSSSTQMDYPRKKRLIDARYSSEKTDMIFDLFPSVTHDQHIQPNVITERADDRIKNNGMDVVSFTFTSPISKTQPMSLSSATFFPNQDHRFPTMDHQCNTRKGEHGTNNAPSTIGMNLITGDALGILLEQKLRELTASSQTNQQTTTDDPSSTAKYPLYSFEHSVDHGTELAYFSCARDKPTGFYNAGSSSSCDSRTLLKESESVISGMMYKDCDHQQPSPFSVLEACFPNESGNSSDSCDNSSNGSLMSLSCLAQQSTSVHDMQDAEIDVSDSATSSYTGNTSNYGERTDITAHVKTFNEINYVQEILACAASGFSDSVTSFAINVLDPHFFDLLESRRRRPLTVCHKDNRLSRKLLFDCVCESFDLKTHCFFRAGYQSWAKGAVLVESGGLPHEIFKEISVWRTMGDWMVDDLVENDMSTSVGRWVDFETDAFEAGQEIESKILSSLIDEMVAELV